MLTSNNFRFLLPVAAALVLVAVTACSGPENGMEVPARGETMPAAGGATPEGNADIETAARDLLTEEVGEGEFVLDSSESVQWPDASLGCPQEGMMYAQVLTPGHKLVFSLAGSTYAVHSNDDGSNLVVCEDGQ